MRIKALVVAVIAFAAFYALGVAVVRNGEPAIFLGWEHALDDRSALIAWWLTWSCYIDVLAPIAIILLIVAWLAPAWRGRILFSIVMLLLCWRGADLFQHIFARPRRLDWFVKHESAFSYPSSHAAIATGFYALWGVMLYLSDLPSITRKVAAAALAIFALVICWARLSLGAHYFTDLLGGGLLAVALVSAGVAVVPNVLRPLARRLSSAGE